MKTHYRICLLIGVITIGAVQGESLRMSPEEKRTLKEEARKMFYHGYDAYMYNAFPADELMPLSCKGRQKGVTPSRGDMDDALGNFSLTLVDSLDTLALFGDVGEFNKGIKLVLEHVTFNQDVVVSVFETNIRVLGGLLSAHVMANVFKERVDILQWYNGELLTLAEDLGKRLLPAFNSATGIPYGRINLKYGLKGLKDHKETCTACAGTMILEMAALSRLTGNTEFEERSVKAMDQLWNFRHRTSDLMGSIINIDSGEWIRKDSGVGAGIDSYYEYCLKAYILLGDDKYFARFSKHYNSIMKYVSRGPMLMDVHMHRPHLQSRNYMDALLAFWPGIQVMLGDLQPAVATHEMLYQVMKKHSFIPEAFSSDLQVIWGQHPLRPEFLESTYFLYISTNDDYYLHVGKEVLKSLQKYARVPCGYAAVNDVRTHVHEDRMDSFVLAETFKYLYLLFGEREELPFPLKHYIMTTEAHFLPLTLGSVGKVPEKMKLIEDSSGNKVEKACPSHYGFTAEDVRKPLQQVLGTTIRPTPKLELVTDPQQVGALEEMGITVVSMADGRVQLLYSTSSAKTPKDAAEGLKFMREMSQRAEMNELEDMVVPMGVKVNDLIISAGPGRFGKDIQGNDRYVNKIVYMQPKDACTPIINKEEASGKFGVAERGQCTFIQKAMNMKDAGVQLAIITDNVEDSSNEKTPLFAMSGDGVNKVDMPAVFLFNEDAKLMQEAYEANSKQLIYIGELESIKREYEQGCPGGDCSGPFQTRADIEREERTFNNIKKVLHQLAKSLELSIPKPKPKPIYTFEEAKRIFASFESRKLGPEYDEWPPKKEEAKDFESLYGPKQDANYHSKQFVFTVQGQTYVKQIPYGSKQTIKDEI